ncbi:MAG: dehydrogenase [Acidobacteria bacterium]|nr:MAG: dehydrogenase [Acidobacteriota bacterium]
MSLPVSSSSPRRVWLLGILSLSLVVIIVVGLFFRFRSKAGPPYSQREALRTIRIDKGFNIEPFAAEPLISSPVAMDWDENGRIYVAEDTGYPLDTRPIGRIVLLEDTNGDGIPDRRTVFADQIVMPNGVMCWKGGVLVTAAPDVWFFKDTTGSGKADVREKILTGFAFTNPQHMVNGPLYGPDNWIYLNHQGPIHTVVFQDPFGDRGSDIRFADGQGPRLRMAPRSVRFRPEIHELEFLSAWSQYGQAFDEWGRHFTVTNDSNGRHDVIAARYLQRNPAFLVSKVQQDVSTDENNKVFPITRNPRFEILTDVGTLTSSCSITLPSMGGTLPASFDRVACVAESAHNMVHCDVWSDAGATYSARRLEQNAEFIASTDAWFRPVNMYIGPDGALYLIDYYRNTIEHPEWMAADTYHAGYLYNGQDRGRIYRIVPDAQSALPLPKNIRLGQAPDAELVQKLASPNIWWRRTAQRLLVEGHRTNAVPLLVRLFEESTSPLGRVHALWTIDGLGKLEPSLVTKALSDPVAGVRENAIRLAEPYLAKSPELTRKLTEMAGDPDAKVRFQLLCTLGFIDSPDAAAAQNKLLADGVEDPWMQVAALTAPPRRALPYFELAVSRFADNETKGRREFFHQVGSVIGMKADAKEMRRLLATVADSFQRNSDWWGGATLDGMAEGVRAKGADAKAALKGDRDTFLRMFERRPGPVGHAAVHLLAVLGLPDDSAAAEALKRAEVIAADRKADAAVRADALELLALAKSDREAPLLESLLDPQEPDAVQIAAVKALSSVRGPKVGALLLAKWNGMSATVRAEATNTLLSGGSDRVRLLLEAVKNGDVQTWQLEPYKPRLFMDSDPAVRQLARSLFEQSSAQREQVSKEYQAALNMAGDAARGKETFTRVCSRCHALDGVGVAVGPNLGTVRNHPASELLEDIILPSKSIEHGFETYVVELASGEIVDGIMSAQTAATITLRQEQGRETVIARQDIKSMRVSKVSLMPEGLEKQISVSQMADLLTFLKDVR